MKRPILLLAGVAALAGCEVRQDPAGSDPSPAPDPTETVSLVEGPDGQSEEPASIIRPDVTPSPVLDVAPDPLTATIGFPDGGYDLDPAAQKLLHSVLVSDQVERGWPIVLRGHTDSAGNDQGNLFASRKRAEAVAGWFEEQGIAAQRIEVVPMGEQNPVTPNARLDGTPNESGRAKNRRVDVWIAPPGKAPTETADAAASGGSEDGP
ncbi:OmpA family protein [Tsuneonella sp. HG222]